MKKTYLLLFFTCFSAAMLPCGVSAQTESSDQREFRIEDRRDDLEQRQEIKKYTTAEEVLEYLKKRAEELKKKKRRDELLKISMSAGVTFGFETNPANDNLQKGDNFVIEDFSFSWLPAFHKKFTGDFTYRLSEQSFFEARTLSTFDHTLSGSAKYYPFESGKLVLTPMVEYDWLIYPYDSGSGYEQSRFSLDVKNYFSRNWNFGGKYEWSYKIYDKKAARDTEQNNLNYHRSDYRNSLEVWAKRYIGKYAVTLKEKSYRNNSNEEYQKFYDFDSHRGYITVAASFLKDNKLYLSYSSNYEIKVYKERLADENISRWDNIIEHKLNAYYTLNKYLTFAPSVSYRKSNSKDPLGVFKDVTYKLGLTGNF